MSAITINIDGSTYTVDPSEIGKINDISADMEVVSAEIAFHGRLLGAAERQIEQMDARYRQWRAESVNNILASDPKMAAERSQMQTAGMTTRKRA